MAQFKVGDRVRRINGCNAWLGGPEAAIVKNVFGAGLISLVGHPGNGAGSGGSNCDFTVSSSLFTLATPPATIQHEGYNYTRGEPIVPEWVKDGAWAVHKESGELRRVKEVKPGVFDLVVNDMVSIRYHDALRDQYRPFTNADWKWGMWAEYKGEKVFVMSGKDGGGVFASRPTNAYFFALFSEITPTTAP